jgi:glycosyltransferase involved in cell wall biosynthesis
MTEISIIVPVYNNVQTIDRCVSSVIRQTFFDIELILINDCSDDGSWEKLSDLAKAHRKIKLINHATRQSASIARKNGIHASLGNFIMFLDADDFLDDFACEKALAAIRSRRVDILQFGTLIRDNGATPQQLAWFERFVNNKVVGPLIGPLIKYCFLDKRFPFTLWNKIYRASLVKIAAANVPDQPTFKAQDLLLQFFILMYAVSFDAVDEALIHYSYGEGITGGSNFDQKKLDMHMSQVNVALEIFAYLERRHASQVFDAILRQIAKHLIIDNLHSVQLCKDTDLETYAKKSFLASWGDGIGRFPSTFPAGFSRLLKEVMSESPFNEQLLAMRG